MTALLVRAEQLGRRLYAARWLPWLLMAIGVLLRADQYFGNRSLWLDESFLALNIVQRTPLQLIQPLDYGQGAPVGFLLAEKLITLVFGDSEYSLRLLPLIAGIASLPLFWMTLRPYPAGRIALALFAVAWPPVYFASEVKQYSSDVAVALALYLLLHDLTERRLGAGRAALLAVAGGVALWLSHPALFVLAGMAGVTGVVTLWRRDWGQAARLAAVAALWAASFAALYLLSLRTLSRSDFLLDYWTAGFLPAPPWSFAAARWLVDSFFAMFENPAGLTLVGLAALAFLLGAIHTARERPVQAGLLLAPLLLTLIAAGLRLYPFAGRLLLFTVPTLLLLIAEGIGRMWQVCAPAPGARKLAPLLLLVLLCYQPVMTALDRFLAPPAREEIKPVLAYVAEHRRAGDGLYLYYGAGYAFEYYRERFGFPPGSYVVGVDPGDDWGGFAADLDRLRGQRRLWIIFSHVTRRSDDGKFILYYLDGMGKRVDAFQAEGAEAFLYELRPSD
jgi:hypothetical protein